MTLGDIVGGVTDGDLGHSLTHRNTDSGTRQDLAMPRPNTCPAGLWDPKVKFAALKARLESLFPLTQRLLLESRPDFPLDLLCTRQPGGFSDTNGTCHSLLKAFNGSLFPANKITAIISAPLSISELIITALDYRAFTACQAPSEALYMGDPIHPPPQEVMLPSPHFIDHETETGRYKILSCT